MNSGFCSAPCVGKHYGSASVLTQERYMSEVLGVVPLHLAPALPMFVSCNAIIAALSGGAATHPSAHAHIVPSRGGPLGALPQLRRYQRQGPHRSCSQQREHDLPRGSVAVLCVPTIVFLCSSPPFLDHPAPFAPPAAIVLCLLSSCSRRLRGSDVQCVRHNDVLRE